MMERRRVMKMAVAESHSGERREEVGCRKNGQ
jgi:hypothetical protein